MHRLNLMDVDTYLFYFYFFSVINFSGLFFQTFICWLMIIRDQYFNDENTVNSDQNTLKIMQSNGCEKFFKHEFTRCF